MRSEATAAAEHAGKVGLLPSLVRYPRTAEIRSFKFLMARSWSGPGPTRFGPWIPF